MKCTRQIERNTDEEPMFHVKQS